jgi:plasmid stabilization system protein ParE
MTYRVRTTRRAEEDAAAIFAWIASAAEQPREAARWLDGLERVLLSLRIHPQRCPLAPESSFLGREVRQLLFHRHRLHFTIERREVRVLHIRHGSRRPASPDEVSAQDP